MTISTFEASVRFLGLSLKSRMTAINIDGDLLLHSPIAIEPSEVEELGRPRWSLSPNTHHHLFAGQWIDRGLEGWAAPGLVEKRPDLVFEHVVDEVCEPFGDHVQLIPLKCIPFTNEVVLLHRPSRSLVVTDLVFNLTQDDPFLTRAALFTSGAYPGCKASLLERIVMKRELARTEIRELLELDFDRLIPGHGAVIETGGKDALRNAYRWLGI